MRKQEIGPKFEIYLEKILGIDRTKSSGSGPWQKLDLEGQGFTISAKASAQATTIKVKDIREAIDNVEAPGGLGGDYIPVLVSGFYNPDDLDSPKEVIASLRLSDLLHLLKDKGRVLQKESKRDKRATAEVPALLRNRKET